MEVEAEEGDNSSLPQLSGRGLVTKHNIQKVDRYKAKGPNRGRPHLRRARSGIRKGVSEIECVNVCVCVSPVCVCVYRLCVCVSSVCVYVYRL